MFHLVCLDLPSAPAPLESIVAFKGHSVYPAQSPPLVPPAQSSPLIPPPQVAAEMISASKEAKAASHLPLLDRANRGDAVPPLVAAAALLAQLDRSIVAAN